MAYMNQERKKALAVGIKKVLKKYSVKATIGVRDHSELNVNIKESTIDFNVGEDGYEQVNEYHIDEHYSGIAKSFLLELKAAMNECEEFSNFNKSDSMTDYFNVGWYIQINIGRWDKPYNYTNKAA